MLKLCNICCGGKTFTVLLVFIFVLQIISSFVLLFCFISCFVFLFVL